MISMARITLGRWGEIVAWITYLALLYCLLSAYIAGGSDLMRGLFQFSGIQIGLGLGLLIFVVIFGGVVTMGIQSVDWVNRLIMLLKVLAFLLIIFSIVPFIHTRGFTYGSFNALWPTATVMITSFGYAIIIPTLRNYFNDNVKQLRMVVVIGSFVPLICYIIWEAVIFGAIPEYGPYGLEHLVHSHQPVTSLMILLSHVSNHDWVIYSAKIFTSICIITAFLGVSLCLIDFLTDGLKLKTEGWQKWLSILVAFVPPMILVLLVPKLFVQGLSLAGIFCVILLILLPAAMAIFGRARYGATAWVMHPVWLALTTIAGFVLLVWSVVIYGWG